MIYCTIFPFLVHCIVRVLPVRVSRLCITLTGRVNWNEFLALIFYTACHAAAAIIIISFWVSVITEIFFDPPQGSLITQICVCTVQYNKLYREYLILGVLHIHTRHCWQKWIDHFSFVYSILKRSMKKADNFEGDCIRAVSEICFKKNKLYAAPSWTWLQK